MSDSLGEDAWNISNINVAMYLLWDYNQLFTNTYEKRGSV
jgi:hypothetical protein